MTITTSRFLMICALLTFVVGLALLIFGIDKFKEAALLGLALKTAAHVVP